MLKEIIVFAVLHPDHVKHEHLSIEEYRQMCEIAGRTMNSNFADESAHWQHAKAKAKIINEFLAEKAGTQTVKGGNTDEFYAKEGTKNKSKMLVDMHPDVARETFRFGRDLH